MSGKHVYVLAGNPGFVKIGVTDNPVLRFQSLSMQGGFEVTQAFVSKVYSNAFFLEREAHKHFEKSRTVGEWFDVPFVEAAAVVRGLCESYGDEYVPEVRTNPESVAPAPPIGLTEREKQILERFGELLPKLTNVQKEKLLSFGEGIAFAREFGDPLKEVIEE